MSKLNPYEDLNKLNFKEDLDELILTHEKAAAFFISPNLV